MDRDDEIRLNAEFTKINFVMERLFADLLVSQGRSPEQIAEFADRLLADWDTGPAGHFGPGTDPEWIAAVREQASLRIALFLSRLRDVASSRR